jgi:hypothetical protein
MKYKAISFDVGGSKEEGFLASDTKLGLSYFFNQNLKKYCYKDSVSL